MPAQTDHVPAMDGQIEQAVFGVLAVHRHFPQYAANQREHLWREVAFTPTAKRRVGLLGDGPTADAAGRQLEALGFVVQAGDAARCDILLCISRTETLATDWEHVFAQLAPDASVVLVGEADGTVLAALRMALDEGRVTAAYLALAGSRPLAPDDALWSHPHVMVAPLA